MRYFYLTLFIMLPACFMAQASISICSWNLKDFGKSKTAEEIAFIGTIVKDFDVLTIQEVVAGYGGAQAVAKLSEQLNKMGTKWDYTVSDPTFSSSYKQERYAFIWKANKLKIIGDAWLEKKFQLEIDREPFYATFQSYNKQFTLVNFHAITKKMQPETEIKYFKFLPAQYPDLNLIFAGDFNCPQSHTVFNPLKSMGYAPALKGQKTSLRQSCINDDCLASEFDNIFYDTKKITAVETGVVHFYKSFSSLAEARAVSDHIPIFLKFHIN